MSLNRLHFGDLPKGIRTQPESPPGSKISSITDTSRENTHVVVCCTRLSAVVWGPPLPPFLRAFTSRRDMNTHKFSSSESLFSALTDTSRENTRVVVCCTGLSAVVWRVWRDMERLCM